ncbi:DegT/DnrJ/EryC1/StrS family aminotransferase [Streptomyces sp. NPDC050535]|uniref:DegT/DnrJ/EryC1/StrS family aminotransferase n=1 Tax=Streptomyces sp. NPDC050535 TaxID=3365626 RepID=UPI003798349F
MRAEVLRLTDDVISSGIFHGGPRVQELERVAGRLWGGHPVGASSGTMALETACRALGIGAGDEVIVPALTFVSTGFAPARTGAVPVVVDIDPRTRTLCADAVRAAITPRTKAVIPVHMYGQCADMDALDAIAGRHGLAVIEDCAQAAGATHHARAAGTLGDIGCFSMWAGKNLGGLSDAGLLIARDSDMVPLLRQLVDLGRYGDRHVHHVPGHRGRLGELDAAVITHQLSLLPQWIEQRRAIADHYNTAFTGLPLQTPTDAPGRPHTYYKYWITLPTVVEARRLADRLAEAQITVERIYPVLPHQQPAFSHLPHRVDSAEHALDLTARTVCLPIAPELTQEEIDHVIHTVLACH